MDKKVFDAEYIKMPDIEAGYIAMPFDAEKEFGSKRVKVVAMLDGVEYRGSVVKMGLPCYMLGIPKEIRLKIGKTFGDIISVEMWKDEEERIVILPDDFKNALKKSDAATAFWSTLSFSNQKKYVLWIESAKKEETRNARVIEAISLLENKIKK